MKKAVTLTVVLFIISVTTWSQSSLNAYKYILIPEQFNFLKSPDQYQVNSLTAFLFEREGFNVVYGNEKFPNDLTANSCLGLRLDVINDSGMFKTKLKITLTDCKNAVIYETKFGASREKEFKKAYHESLRGAFEEFETMDYEYKEVPVDSSMEPKVISPVDGKVEIAVVKDTAPKKQTKDESVVAVKKVIADASEKNVEKKIENEQRLVEKAIKTKAPKKTLRKLEGDPQEFLKRFTVEGSYEMGNWGRCTIAKKDDYYTVIGGDENFEFASIYATSKPNHYIIKWAAYKQPRLVTLGNEEGNLIVDGENGVTVYKRID